MNIYKNAATRYILITTAAIIVFYAIWGLFDANLRAAILDGRYSLMYYLEDIASCVLCSAMAFVYSRLLFRYIVAPHNYGARIIVYTAALLFVNNVTAYLLHIVSAHVWHWQDSQMENMYVFGTIATLVSVTYTNEEYGKIFLRKERAIHRLEMDNALARQMKAEGRLSLLKSQISPHFLFNSFSILSELIEEDATTANNFLTGLSDICRYVVANISKDLVPLSDEIRMATAYAHILHMRFGQSISINIDPTPMPGKYLPPMSLQILIENAIKHNARHDQSPLHITIEAQAQGIVVTNNLAPLTHAPHSTKTGLQNLTSRYALLSHSLPTFHTTESHYIAHLPYITPSQP